MNALDRFLAGLAGVVLAFVVVGALQHAAGGAGIFAKPLARAIELGQQVRVERLLQRGASANIAVPFFRLYSEPIQAERNDYEALSLSNQQVQLTPLMLATFFNRPGIVQSLLQHGADVHAEALDGSTAMRIAYTYNRREIREVLKKAGGMLQDSLRLKSFRPASPDLGDDGVEPTPKFLFRPSG